LGPVLLGLIGALQPLAPALALEEVVVRIPLLEASFTLRVSELQNPQRLRSGTSDLAQLDRASNGAVGRQLAVLLGQPVPISITQLADGSVGSPLLEQALLVLSSFGQVEGRPADLSGETLRQALRQASQGGEATLLDLIEAIPGHRVTLDLGQAWTISNRMARQRRVAEQLIASQPAVPAASAPTPAAGAAAVPVLSRERRLTVAHRSAPLELLVLEPGAGARGQLVLISHGLWDGPGSFEGWGRLLAGRGYTVILPRHPGSDTSQQEAVLTGTSPPPGPEELALRPRDLRAVIDAVDQLGLASPVDPKRVVVLGHSWGATTALQLAGVRPTDAVLRQRCGDLQDPERNLSWTLQCSWLQGIDQAAIQDPRVLAVAAVSPPVSLLFPQGSAQQLSGRVLLVSGSRDWVVPPDPEAIAPMRRGVQRGNQLVLVQGGDHFNLRPGLRADGGVLGPLLLAWTDAAFAAGAAARPEVGAAPLLSRGPWGNAVLPLVEVTGALTPP
jgi:predicted dienelactone hydrolase